ncbi:MAG: phosphoribosylamine--glycine ligase, partial [Bdellovibrionota bacterium]
MATVLVIGSGGREHALGWKLAESTHVDRIIVAPGNDAYPANWERWPVNLSGGKEEFDQLADKAVENDVDLIVVGPDNALADGIVDAFQEVGLKTFGPTAAAARIESSKAFSKEVMKAAGVATAEFKIMTSVSEAKKFLVSCPWPPKSEGWVVKADGLALGKGVRVCTNLSEAVDAVDALIGISGKIVIEEKLVGEELSWFAFSDGERCAVLDTSRDYKKIFDGDLGPNTGGMGAFSPVPEIPDRYFERVRKEVFLPTLAELKKRGTPFRGLLYAGLMVNLRTDEINVIEFNARFGDPETH